MTAPVWSVPGIVKMREWSGEIRARQQYWLGSASRSTAEPSALAR